MVKTKIVLGAKLKRDIKQNWKQFLAIIFIAGLAVTLYVGLSANSQIFCDRVSHLYEAGNMADVWTTVTQYDAADETALRAIDGVSAFDTRFVISADVNGKAADALITDGDPIINHEATLEKGSHGFMLDQSVASVLKINVGDDVTVHFKAPSLSLIDGKDFTFVVTGIMTHPENLQNGSFSESYFLLTREVFYASFENMVNANYSSAVAPALISGFENSYVLTNQYLMQVSDEGQIKTVVESVNSYFGNFGDNRLVMCLDINNLPSNNVVQNDIVQAEKLTIVFPTIFFLVAVLVILTTLSQIILKERIQIGTMKALGLRKREIISHYLSLDMTVVSIGIVLGCIVGPLLLPFIMNQKYKILYSLPALGYSFPVWPAVGCALLLLLLSAIVCYLVIRKEINLTPAGSMRPAAPKAQKKLMIERIATREKGDMSVKMALRNIRVNLAKSMMVVIGVMGCTALLVCGFGIDDTLNHGVDVDMSEFYAADMIASYSSGNASLKSQIEAIPGVARAEEFSAYPATLAGVKTATSHVYVINDDSSFYDVPCPDGQIIISAKTADEIKAQAGDEITFTVLGANYSGTIGVVHESFYTHGIFVRKSLYPDLADSATNAWIDVQTGYAVEDVKADVIEGVLGVSSMTTREAMLSKINNILSGIHLMTLTVKVFAILLAVVVLYNLAMLNYKERYRDIATLRVLGFTRFEIAKSLIIEVMLLTVAGAFFGIFLGKPLEILVLSINKTPLVAFLYTVYPLSYVFAIALTLVTALMINIWLGSLTNRVPMVESLKSIE